jgi:TfoX/Sxy family transcriptional regulator of competence genes
MAMKFSPEHEAAMHDLMQDVDGAVPGKMFGMPCYKVNGKMAVGVFENGIVLKVGEKQAQAMTKSGAAQPFEPMPGRPWKEWVLLTGDFDKHKKLFKDAVELAKQSS